MEDTEELIKLKKLDSIDSTRITAMDEDGNTVIIEVAECIKNFYNEMMGPDYKITKEDNLIGERNGMADPKYIIFFPIRYIILNLIQKAIQKSWI